MERAVRRLAHERHPLAEPVRDDEDGHNLRLSLNLLSGDLRDVEQARCTFGVC